MSGYHLIPFSRRIWMGNIWKRRTSIFQYCRKAFLLFTEANCLFTNNLSSSNPAIKPPIWAAYATPPVSSPSAPILLINWNRNHKPTAIKAGTEKMPNRNQTWTRRPGCCNIYPPMTPDIAPEAPRLGMYTLWLENAVNNTWQSAAMMPHKR